MINNNFTFQQMDVMKPKFKGILHLKVKWYKLLKKVNSLPLKYIPAYLIISIRNVPDLVSNRYKKMWYVLANETTLYPSHNL